MRPRFLLVVAQDQALLGRLSQAVALRTGLELAAAQPTFAVFVDPPAACLAIANRGLVLGTLFHRHGPARPIGKLDAGDAEAILAAGADGLLRRYWGGYVGALAGRETVRIFRDPSAALPCYFVRRPDFAVFASDVDLLVEAGLVDVQFDWDELARHFFSAGVPSPATALREVSELLPGHALQFPGSEPQQPIWSPWDHVRPEPDPAIDSADRLERIVRHCVQAWAAGRGRLLVSVSGGLDSSVVAACLARSEAETTCLTMFGLDPAGDERLYARALCTHFGFDLVERQDRLEEIDLSEPLAPHLPRPIGRTQALTYERAHIDTARRIGASAFVTGNGGDSVFGYSQSAAAIADRYLAGGGPADLIRTLRDVCRQTGAGPAEAARNAWRIAHGPRSYQCRPNPLFLHPDQLARLESITLDHPWLDAPSDALPGKAAHIASILRVQQCLEPGRSRHLPVLNPLMSQPIIEACLAIPSWEWRAGGWDRAAARRAFAASLPDLIVRRRVKGGPDGFAARILDHYRPAIRDRLREGHLARQGVIDLRAVENALDDERPILGDKRVRILEFVAAEAWADAWAARAGAGPPKALAPG